MSIMAIALVLIFLNSLGWLQLAYDFLTKYWNTNAVSAIILLVLVVIFMIWISKEPKAPGSKKKDKGDE